MQATSWNTQMISLLCVSAASCPGQGMYTCKVSLNSAGSDANEATCIQKSVRKRLPLPTETEDVSKCLNGAHTLTCNRGCQIARSKCSSHKVRTRQHVCKMPCVLVAVMNPIPQKHETLHGATLGITVMLSVACQVNETMSLTEKGFLHLLPVVCSMQTQSQAFHMCTINVMQHPEQQPQMVKWQFN